MDHAAPPSLLRQQLPPARHSNLRRSAAQLLMLLGVESGVLWLNGLWTLTGQDRHHLVICLAWLAWFGFYRKAYVRRQTFWEELRQTVLAAMVFTMLSSRLLNQIPNWEQIRSALLLYPLLVCSIVPGRALARLALKQLGLWYQPVLVFGSGRTAALALKALHGDSWLGMRVQALLQPADLGPPAEPGQGPVPCLVWQGLPDDWEVFRRFRCVIALEASQQDPRDRLIRQLLLHRVYDVRVIPAMRGIPLYGAEMQFFFSQELFSLTLPNKLLRPHLRLVKRAFDLVSASLLLLLLSPLLAWVAWRIWREDGGPVLFIQERVGPGGKPFRFYKFRSMVNDAEGLLRRWEAENSPEWQRYVASNFKLEDDPRVLRVGRFIRGSSIDELPQLLNVLRGEMSLVGPRPLLPREVSEYGEALQLYGQVRPGLTGLWQVSGRSKTTFSERVIYDDWYIKNWSLWTDIAILAKTVRTVLRREGAY